MPLPGWLVGASADQNASWSDRLRAVHPHDRALVAAAWQSALERPGERISYTVRARSDTELYVFEELMLNMEGREGLNVVVTSLMCGQAPDVDDWEALEKEYDFESTAVAIEYLDEFGTVLGVEGQVDEIFGRTAAAMVGHWALEHILEKHHDTLLALWLSLVAEPRRIQSMRLQITRPDQSSVWVETTLINRLEDPRIGAVLALSHDITDQLAAEEASRAHEAAVRQSHEEFAALANQVPAAVFRADPDGKITFANQHWQRLAGVDCLLELAAGGSEGHLAGSSDAPVRCVGDKGQPISLYDVISREDRTALESSLLLLFGSDDAATESIEVRSRRSDQVFCVTCQSVSAPSDDLHREIIGTMTDVTSTTHLRHRAAHDGLTGLLNRTGIEACLGDALRESEGPVIVAFIDLDGFKAVNDEYGHGAGDTVLIAMAARLQEATRPSDHLGRYGGDEFVIVCPGASPNAEHAVRTRIEAVLSSPIEIPGGTWHPAVSVGLARSRGGERATALVQRADRSMYAMKRAHHRRAGIDY
jgi:diguanylate cyclase (GGDEF)-like protein/PAS domain S-box-containing protein